VKERQGKRGEKGREEGREIEGGGGVGERKSISQCVTRREGGLKGFSAKWMTFERRRK